MGSAENRVKRGKPPVILGLVKYEPKEEIYLFGCLKVIIAHNLSQLMAMSFMSGFIDVNIFVRWGFFGTFQTGNTCFLAMVFYPRGSSAWQFVTSAQLLITTILIGSVGASFLNSFCLEFTGSREITFAIFTTMTCILCGLDGILTGPDSHNGSSHSNPFLLMPLLLFLNSLACWGNATGFLTNLMTGNLMKLGKSLYLGCRSYSQGGAKARGDSVTLLMIFISFFGGVLFSVKFHGEYYRRGNTLLPMAFMWPIFMLVSGVLPEKYRMTAYFRKMAAADELGSKQTGGGASLIGNSSDAVSETKARSKSKLIAFQPLAKDDVKAEKEKYLNKILAETNLVDEATPVIASIHGSGAVSVSFVDFVESSDSATTPLSTGSSKEGGNSEKTTISGLHKL